MSTPSAPTPEWVYALTERLVALGSGGVQEEDRGCVTFFAEPPNTKAFQAKVESALGALSADARCVWSWQPHEEWAEVWRQGFAAHDFGHRLRVAPPWINGTDDPTREVVFIDPGVAFGTAEHGSTRGCLTLLEPIVAPGDRILDVGAGSGVLSIAAIRLGARSADCVEIDAMACEALAENAQRNAVLGAVTIHNHAFTPSTLDAPYEIVVCNMVRGRLRPLLLALAARVARAGTLILGGCTVEEADAMIEDLDALGAEWQRTGRIDDEGWVAFALQHI